MQAKRLVACLAVTTTGGCPDPAAYEDSPCPAVAGAPARYGDPGYSPPIVENPCPPSSCGGNSPVVGGVYFWRLHPEGMVENPEQVRVIKVLSSAGHPLRLHLAPEGDRLVGDDLVTLGSIDRSALINTKLELSVRGSLYDIYIENVDQAGERFWIDPMPPIETYDFRYKDHEEGPIVPPQPQQPPLGPPLCSEGDRDPNHIKAIAFGGDIYDPVTKAIEVGAATDGWLNIACADSAIYKMHRIGYTTAAQARLAGFATTLEQRRAMLNAWTANLCGDGMAFTRQGEEITLREVFNKFDVPPYNDRMPPSYEALWTETGAACLNVPRLRDKEPNICSELTAHCKLPPPCDAALIEGDRWRLSASDTHYFVLTGNLPPSH